MPSGLDKIEHVVVLMLENRSFDHILGYLRVKKDLPVDGLTGIERNPDADGNPVTVNPLASTVFPTDLGHSSADVRAQLKNGNQGFVTNYLQQRHHGDASLAMGYHDETHVWAYDRLASGFAVCDHWHSALAGPTIPNRLFAVAGQSDGDTDQPPLGVKIYEGVRTVFDCLDAGLSMRPKRDRWAYYFHDLPLLGLLKQHLAELVLPGHRIRKIDEFFARARAGDLPAVSWIDPNFADLGKSNDDHPPKSDLYDGQLLVKSVYDAVVGGGNRLFAKTLLVFTYDEHGGFFDHVPPPSSGDSPPFDSFGVRVPCLVVSPWIPAGTIDHTERSHASILSTILNRFAPDERLTARVDRAPDLGALLMLPEARSDAPTIVPPPRPAAPLTRALALAAPGSSDTFFDAYRAELARRGVVLDGAPLPPKRRGRPSRPMVKGVGPVEPPATTRATTIVRGDPGRPIRILAVHGVGNQDQNPAPWQSQWSRALRDGVARWTARPIEVEFLVYDDIFAARPLSAADVAVALLKLGWNGLASFGSDLLARTRGLAETPNEIRWTAGMVVQWIEDQGGALRSATRRRVLEKFAYGQRWDVVAAHSLGSLVCYDAFASQEGRHALEDSVFLTFGSQLGNPFVRGAFGGRIDPLDGAFWYHLFNPHDPVFTHSLAVFGGRFRQVLLDLSLPGLLSEHDAVTYLTAATVVTSALHDIAVGVKTEAGSRGFSAVARADLGKCPPRRALLLGINDYPDPANRLDGCVNDVYLVSEVLQELGFEAENIRLLLNDRATTANIKDRIEWLLEGTEDGQQRFLFYSGHGAQIPAYNAAEEVDHLDECLVPYDFDWTAERSIMDNWFASLYAQLPYEAQFVVVFDCCHSGGMTRAGGAKVRGLTPPDDIRHRALEWSRRDKAWVPRPLTPWNDERCLPRRLAKTNSAARRRLGCASEVRTVSHESGRLDSLRREFRNKGPFMPVLFEACQEGELAYEYRAGALSYGTFTYFLAQTVRSRSKRKEPLTFQALLDEAATRVGKLYKQTPQLEAPRSRRHESILTPPPASPPEPTSKRSRTRPKKEGRRRAATRR